MRQEAIAVHQGIDPGIMDVDEDEDRIAVRDLGIGVGDDW